MDVVLIVLVFVLAAPIIYVVTIASRAAIALEKAKVDDISCEPGHTNYGGPM
jgi:hypothetical protein